jgi:plastocyanin
MRIKGMLAIAMLFTIGLTACANNSAPGTGNTVVTNDNAIKLTSTDSGQYSPAEIRVKLGSKVRIEGDPQTLSGGMDTVIIDGYNVRKLIAPDDNKIEFVADKTGTYDMYCANGMGNGKLIVE